MARREYSEHVYQEVSIQNNGYKETLSFSIFIAGQSNTLNWDLRIHVHVQVKF